MRTKKLMVDMDQILVESLVPWIEAYNRDYDDDFTVQKMTDWDFKNCGLKCNTNTMHSYMREPGFFRNAKPLPGAIEAINKIHCMTGPDEHFVWDIKICTASMNPMAFKEKAEWFGEHLPFLNKRQLWFGHDKWLLECDAYIDDKPDTLVMVRNKRPTAHVITIDYPYNAPQKLAELARKKGFEVDRPIVDLRAFSHSNTVGAWEIIAEYLGLVAKE